MNKLFFLTLMLVFSISSFSYPAKKTSIGTNITKNTISIIQQNPLDLLRYPNNVKEYYKLPLVCINPSSITTNNMIILCSQNPASQMGIPFTCLFKAKVLSLSILQKLPRINILDAHQFYYFYDHLLPNPPPYPFSYNSDALIIFLLRVPQYQRALQMFNRNLNYLREEESEDTEEEEEEEKENNLEEITESEENDLKENIENEKIKVNPNTLFDIQMGQNKTHKIIKPQIILLQKTISASHILNQLLEKKANKIMSNTYKNKEFLTILNPINKQNKLLKEINTYLQKIINPKVLQDLIFYNKLNLSKDIYANHARIKLSNLIEINSPADIDSYEFFSIYWKAFINDYLIKIITQIDKYIAPIRYLNLEGWDIEELPKDLIKLKNLEYLNLKNNRIFNFYNPATPHNNEIDFYYTTQNLIVIANTPSLKTINIYNDDYYEEIFTENETIEIPHLAIKLKKEAEEGKFQIIRLKKEKENQSNQTPPHFPHSKKRKNSFPSTQPVKK